ncbi:MAG TPA: FTR1 family protein [Symbiobacteriaceae bacterium]|nr:FTR1 family protein [Symbiobacteriaceae bacterium]
MRIKRIARLFLTVLLLTVSLTGLASATPSGDLQEADQIVAQALTQAKQGDLSAAKATYDSFHERWRIIEEGIKAESITAYRTIEEEMATVAFALLQNPVDGSQLSSGLQRLQTANQTFITGGFPADGGQKQQSSGNISGLLTLLEQAKAQAEAHDVAGAAASIEQFRHSWLDVEGIVLTASGQVYGDAERDMVTLSAYLTSKQPDLTKAITLIDQMHNYLAPLVSKTSYNVFDAATIVLREGLEALLVTVALLAFLKKAGHPEKGRWIWGGVGAGLLVSAVLAVAVKFLIGTGAFGSNNFLIMGFSGLFAASMLIWVSYWLHSKSSLVEWQRYIREQSTSALATGRLLSLATLSFLAVFREGTETVLFYVGMASSIAMKDLLLGLALGLGILAVIAVVILKWGIKVPMRPFFLVSSLLVFYLAFKFTGMGVHGLQLAGLLRATVVPYLPTVDFLGLYPNWEGTIPQLLLLMGGLATFVWQHRRDRIAKAALVATQ